jgi:hypothetical protein
MNANLLRSSNIVFSYNLHMDKKICRGCYLDFCFVVTSVRNVFFGSDYSLNFQVLCKKVHVYLECHSVFPFVRIGISPPPLPQAKVSPPPNGKDTLACGRARGPKSDYWRKSIVLCLLCGARLPRRRMIWLLPHPLPPCSPLSR